jgi:acetyl esterase/lipase
MSAHPRPFITTRLACAALAFAILPFQGSAGEPEVITLWPGGAPEPAGFEIGPEAEITRDPPDGVRRLGDVSVPTLEIRHPAPDVRTGTAVLVCPGGGYNILAIEHEGTQVCDWLNSLGVTAALLKYRVPRRDKDQPHVHPLQDTQRAMSILRTRAEKLGIHPERIGALGFSAGGNLVVMLALHGDDKKFQTDPALDSHSSVPGFVVPIYPAYLTSNENPWELLPEIRATDATPPMCLIHAHDDRITASGSALLYLECKRHNRPAELHIYNSGGHGFGMKVGGKPVHQWPQRVESWMRDIGMLPAPDQ